MCVLDLTFHNLGTLRRVPYHASATHTCAHTENPGSLFIFFPYYATYAQKTSGTNYVKRDFCWTSQIQEDTIEPLSKQIFIL